MGHKIITEKDYWQCTGGMMPTPFQGQQKIAQKAGGEKYIVKTDLSTISHVDFGCKKIMLLYAVIAAIAAVAACLIVATGGLALVLIAAGAGAAGAVFGSAIGTLICGQQAAAACVWLSYKSNFKILGIETITGGDKMQCNAFTFLGMQPEFITFNPQIKNWTQAIKMGAASFVANVLQGAMTGMMIGAAAVALPALLEGGTAAFIEGGALNTMRFLGSNVIRNYAASWLTGEGLLLRGAITAQSGLEGYGQRGEVTDTDIKNGIFGMEMGTAQSLQHIASGSTNPLDYIGVALWFTPVGKMRKGNEESRSGERDKGKEETNNARSGIVESGEMNQKGSYDAFEMKSDGAPENVRGFENKIKDEPIEHGQFFDKDGNPIGDEFIGSENKIDISSGEPIAKDAVFTHNHPNNGTFSPADLTTATNFNMAEIRAKTQNGTYSMKRGANGWEVKSPNEMDAISREAQSELRNDPEARRLHQEGNMGAVNDMLMNKIADKIGGVYSRY